MMYTVNMTSQCVRDVKEVIFYKKQLGTYDKNIKSFTQLLTDCLDTLSFDANVGTNLSSRIAIETKIKYRMVEQYMVLYEVSNHQVNVLRLLSTKSNWLNIITQE